MCVVSVWFMHMYVYIDMCGVCYVYMIYFYMCECMETGGGALGVLLYHAPLYKGSFIEHRVGR